MNYKGNDNFRTKLGALISIAIQVLVLVTLFQKVIEMIDMTDPSINLYSRPMYEAESNDYGELSLHEMGLNVGIVIKGKTNQVVVIPPEVGRFTTEVVSYTPKGRESEILDASSCTDLFQKVESSPRFVINSEGGFCFDSIASQVKGANTFSATKSVALKFEPCLQKTITAGETLVCYDKTQIEAWSRQNNSLRGELFYSFSFVDFADEHEPLKHSVTYYSVGSAAIGTSMQGSASAQIHQVTVVDDMWNPFPTTSLETEYLSLDELSFAETTLTQQEIVDLPDNQVTPIDIRFEITLGGKIFVEQRTRYTLWDLLGDVGGFNDGLYLVASLLMATYSAAAFRQDLLNDAYNDTASSKSRDSHQHSKRYKDTVAGIKREDDSFKVDKESLGVLTWSLEHVRRLNHSIWQSIFDTCSKLNRERRLKALVFERMERQIDIRSVIKDHIDLRIWFARTLTKQQQALFEYQRDRVPCLDDSETDLDEKLFSAAKLEKLAETLEGFQPMSDLDRKLLLGLLEREKTSHEKRMKRVVKKRRTSQRQPYREGQTSQFPHHFAAQSSINLVSVQTRKPASFDSRQQIVQQQLSPVVPNLVDLSQVDFANDFSQDRVIGQHYLRNDKGND